MKKILFFSFLLIIIGLNSCKKDNWTEWRMMNDQGISDILNDPDFIKSEKSSLRYKIIDPGAQRTPNPTSVVQVRYTGRLIDGTVAQSAKTDTWVDLSNSERKGWREGLQKIKGGGTIILYVPYDLGYGSKGSGSAIPPYSTMVYEIELLDSNF